METIIFFFPLILLRDAHTSTNRRDRDQERDLLGLHVPAVPPNKAQQLAFCGLLSRSTPSNAPSS
jgi:hypothetical protein